MKINLEIKEILDKRKDFVLVKTKIKGFNCYAEKVVLK